MHRSGLKKLSKVSKKWGGKLVSFYTTMGEYDYAAIAESPSDEVAMTYLLGPGSAGNVRTTTLKAFTKEQLAAIVKKLP